MSFRDRWAFFDGKGLEMTQLPWSELLEKPQGEKDSEASPSIQKMDPVGPPSPHSMAADVQRVRQGVAATLTITPVPTPAFSSQAQKETQTRDPLQKRLHSPLAHQPKQP